jgi:hypothetical protein
MALATRRPMVPDLEMGIGDPAQTVDVHIQNLIRTATQAQRRLIQYGQTDCVQLGFVSSPWARKFPRLHMHLKPALAVIGEVAHDRGRLREVDAAFTVIAVFVAHNHGADDARRWGVKGNPTCTDAQQWAYPVYGLRQGTVVRRSRVEGLGELSRPLAVWSSQW